MVIFTYSNLELVFVRIPALPEASALCSALNASLPKAIDQEKLKVAGITKIDPGKLEPGQPLEYCATLEVYPEIKVKNLDGQKLEIVTATVADADIDDAIDKMRRQKSTFKEVPRAAQDGDRLIIDFKGLKDGEPFEGGTAEHYQLELGSGSFIPGFEEKLIGAAAESEHKLDLTFPENYQSADLAGAAVVFEVKVHSVSEPQLPELDDEFAKVMQIKDGTVAALKEDVKQSLEKQIQQSAMAENKKRVFDKLLELNQFDTPQVLVDKTMEEGKKTDEAAARKQVQMGLLLGAYIEQNDLKVEQDQVKAKIDEMVSTYEDPEQMKGFFFRNKKLMEQIESSILEEQALEKLLESAKSKEKEVSFTELMQLS